MANDYFFYHNFMNHYEDYYKECDSASASACQFNWHSICTLYFKPSSSSIALTIFNFLNLI